jgi:hypothetical protein
MVQSIDMLQSVSETVTNEHSQYNNEKALLAAILPMLTNKNGRFWRFSNIRRALT